MALSTRREDSELEDLIFTENLHNVNFSSLAEQVDSLIEKEENCMLKYISRLDEEDGIFLKEFVKDPLQSICEEVDEVFQKVRESDKLITEIAVHRMILNQATEESRIWERNVDTLSKAIGSLISCYSLSPITKSNFQTLNEDLQELSSVLQQERLKGEDLKLVTKVVGNVHKLLNELNLALQGRNNAVSKLDEDPQPKRRAKQFLQENLAFVAEKREYLDTVKLSTITNVTFVILGLVNALCARVRHKLENLAFAKISSQNVIVLVEECVHEKLVIFGDIIKFLPKEQYQELQKCYKEEMTEIYTLMVQKNFAMLFESSLLSTRNGCKLDLSSCNQLHLSDSPESKEVIQQQFLANKTQAEHLFALNASKTGEFTYNRAFETFIDIFMHVIDLEISFIGPLFFYFESKSANVQSVLSKKKKITFGTRKVQFGVNTEEFAENEGKDMFSESDAFLFELFLTRIDLIKELHTKVWRKVMSSDIHYEVLFICQYLEHKFDTSKKFRYTSGREFHIFFKDTLEKVVKNWLEQFFSKQLNVLSKAIKNAKLDPIFKLPDFMHKVLSILRSQCNWIEDAILKFMKDLGTEVMGKDDLLVMDVSYFLKHSLFFIINHDNINVSQSFRTSFTEVMKKLDFLYLKSLNSLTAVLLKSQFDFLLKFLDDANHILTTFLKEPAQHKDLLYHIPFERFKSVLALLIATELDLEIMTTSNKRCYPCKQNREEDLVSRLQNLARLLEKKAHNCFSETRENLRERVVEALLNNFRTFKDIGINCYGQEVKMTEVNFENLMRRNLNTES